MGLFGKKRITRLEEVLDTLKDQVTIQWQSSSTETRAAEALELLRDLRSRDQAVEAAAALDSVRTPKWPSFALGNDPAEAMESLARGGWRPADGRDEKWAELMARFDQALRD